MDMVAYRQKKRQRLAEYDYTSVGWYFITTCVHNRLPVLSHINRWGDIAVSHKSEQGEIVEQQLHWLEESFPYITIDTHIIMPDHIHATLILHNHNGKAKTLSQLVGAFKSTASKHLHNLGFKDFLWQRSFYDRIIRNEQELAAIRNYIQTNPLRWCIKRDIN